MKRIKQNWFPLLFVALLLVAGAIAQISLNPTVVAPNTGMYASFQDGAQSNSRQLNVDILFLDSLLGTAGLQVGSGSAINISGTSGSSLTSKGLGMPIEVSQSLPATTVTQTTQTLYTPQVTGNFRVSFYSTQTVLGASCAGNTTSTITLVYQDPNAVSTTTTGTLEVFTVTTNGTLGPVPVTTTPVYFPFRAKVGVPIQVTNTIGPGGSCSPVPTTQLFAVLEAL